jgi:hypothetical protein
LSSLQQVFCSVLTRAIFAVAAAGFLKLALHYSLQASLPTASPSHVLILLQLVVQPNGACIALQPAARQVDIGMFLHVVDPFTDQPQQRSL